MACLFIQWSPTSLSIDPFQEVVHRWPKHFGSQWLHWRNPWQFHHYHQRCVLWTLWVFFACQRRCGESSQLSQLATLWRARPAMHRQPREQLHIRDQFFRWVWIHTGARHLLPIPQHLPQAFSSLLRFCPWTRSLHPPSILDIHREWNLYSCIRRCSAGFWPDRKVSLRGVLDCMSRDQSRGPSSFSFSHTQPRHGLWALRFWLWSCLTRENSVLWA